MRKLLILCFVTVLICCDNLTSPETKPRYSSYFIEYDGMSDQAWQEIMSHPFNAKTDYEFCKRYPAITDGEEYPADAPPPVHETMGFSAMKEFVQSRPQMHDAFRDAILHDLERDGASFAYFVEKPRDYLYYLYIEGRD